MSSNVPMHAKSKILSHKDKIFTNIAHVHFNGNSMIAEQHWSPAALQLRYRRGLWDVDTSREPANVTRYLFFSDREI